MASTLSKCLRDGLSSLGIEASEDPSEYGSMVIPASKGDSPSTAYALISDQTTGIGRKARTWK